MSHSTSIATQQQRAYYASTAALYDDLHLADDEHTFALALLSGLIDHLGVTSILDVGSGTGRAITFLEHKHPGRSIVGIEPVAELRQLGHAKGIPSEALVDGDANSLPFADGSFDLVSAFGVLHHIPQPSIAVTEMLRVARTAIYISDCNNYGQGKPAIRLAKQGLRALNCWRLADRLKTRGRGYTQTEGDGIAYSYSVFDSYKQISRACSTIHLMNTKDGAINPYRTASHIALLGVKR